MCLKAIGISSMEMIPIDEHTQGRAITRLGHLIRAKDDDLMRRITFQLNSVRTIRPFRERAGGPRKNYVNEALTLACTRVGGSTQPCVFVVSVTSFALWRACSNLNKAAGRVSLTGNGLYNAHGRINSVRHHAQLEDAVLFYECPALDFHKKTASSS